MMMAGLSDYIQEAFRVGARESVPLLAQAAGSLMPSWGGGTPTDTQTGGGIGPFRERMEDWFVQQLMPDMGGAAPSPTPQERNQRGPGYRLNPYEQDILGALNAGVAAGLDPQVASQMLMGTVEGAIGRRQENIATRNEGMQGLQELAMQMAQAGAAPDALASSIQQQAQLLPGMRGPRGEERMQGLSEYVYGMYPDGSEVSGLAPADYRAQFETGGLTEEIRAAIGGGVVDGIRQGMSMKDIRENVRRDMIALGLDDAQMAEGIGIAENAYEQVTGAPLEDVRMVGDLFRNYEAGGNVEGLLGEIDDPALREQIEQLYSQSGSPTGMLGTLGGDPGAISQLANELRPAPPSPQGGGGGAGMMGGYLKLLRLLTDPSSFGASTSPMGISTGLQAPFARG